MIEPVLLLIQSNFPTSTLNAYNSGNFWNFFMKIEIDTRLTIGNKTTLKYLGNFISDLSFVAGYPAYIVSPKKVCKN